MKRKIIFIIVGALLILALIFLLWFWFFGRHNKADVLPGNGSLGTSQNAGNTSGGSGGSGNGQAPYGSNAGSNTSGGSGSGSSGSGTGGAGSVPTIPDYTYTAGDIPLSYYSSPYGVTWLTTGSNGGGYSFSTTPINSVSGGTVNGTPYIPTVTGADGQQISIFSSLLTVIGGCLLEYGVQEAIVRPATTAVDAGVGSAANILGSLFGFLGVDTRGDTPFNPLYVNDNATEGKTSTNTVAQCLARTLGRIAVAQITQSTVNWINSGFNGQPAYVQDYGKFFSNIADQSAGNFIQGSALAFLCSPFQLQVKIAIAQAYANRKSGSASSCTLTGVTNNIDNFLKGDFVNGGGWPAFLQFTTVPANNPYAGYVQGQIALNNQIIYDTNNVKSGISPGGFLSQQKCDKDSSGRDIPGTCKIITPGSSIEASLEATFGQDIAELGLGDSLDQILGALTNSLITKVLYGGLANAGQASASGPNAATTQAQSLMNSIQSGVTAAQQYATIEQGAISDIQSSQRNLATLADCWSKVASSTTASPDAQAQGASGFNSTVASITSLQDQVAQYNNKIVAANASIVQLQSLQTDLLLATVASDVNTVSSRLTAFKAANNPHFYTSTDVTTAQQDRASVQSNLLNGINQDTSTQLAQCYAVSQ